MEKNAWAFTAYFNVILFSFISRGAWLYDIKPEWYKTYDANNDNLALSTDAVVTLLK